MTLHLTIYLTMDNAAFEGNWTIEAARILRRLAEDLQSNPGRFEDQSFRLRDLNGNVVGTALVERRQS